MNNTMFDTTEINIETICDKNYKFIIPVYQRPYVWNKMQIVKLLDDIKDNVLLKSKYYYVGNVYVSRRSYQNAFDVIDGQQRFTTFWLFSFYFKNTENSGLKRYIKTDENELRLDFEIRQEVTNYLNNFENEAKFFNDNLENQEFLKYISEGIKTIRAYFEIESNNNLQTEIEEFIFRKVKFIFNIAPENTDLNSLFTTLGNSGLQLEQSDILKVRLLNKVKDESLKYSKIWEACENMNAYFERNVLEVFTVADKESLSLENFKEFDANIFHLNSDNSFEQKNAVGISISEIIKNEKIINVFDKKNVEGNNRCRSIVSFNALLLHTYRIYKLYDNDGDISVFDPKKLLEIFEDLTVEVDKNKIKYFFELLWKIRYLLDNYVVKWRYPNSEDVDKYEEHLLLTSLTKNKTSFIRSNQSFSEMQMLQSVLYFNSGGSERQYWLTPFLKYLLENENADNLTETLENIDNYMLPGDKKMSSWQISNCFFIKKEFDFAELNKNLGTGFEHYWFYKLEYLLWKNWDDRNKEEFKRYRITSKNSIEHVFPQNQEYKIKLDDLQDNNDWLNSFGNLSLLSVGQNSSYSNQDVDKKRIDFEKKDVYDSLKLAKVYPLGKWSTVEIKEHQEKMIAILENHYN